MLVEKRERWWCVGVAGSQPEGKGFGQRMQSTGGKSGLLGSEATQR